MVAGHVHAFFKEAHNNEIIASLAQAGLQWKAVEVNQAEQPLAGQTWVLTGALGMPRAKAKNMLESLGAKVSGSVSGKTSVVLAGEAAGSKLKKAVSLGIKAISEAEFLQLMAEHGKHL